MILRFLKIWWCIIDMKLIWPRGWLPRLQFSAVQRWFVPEHRHTLRIQMVYFLPDQEARDREDERPIILPHVLRRIYIAAVLVTCCSASWRFQRAVRLKSAETVTTVNVGNITLIKLRLIKVPMVLKLEVPIKLKKNHKIRVRNLISLY